MRNANEQDVARAKATGKLEEKVMYWCNKGTKAHGKNVHQEIVSIVQERVGSEYKIDIAEDVYGFVFDVDINTIEPIGQKGSAQQPKKPRRKPRKGTKPETKLPMSADVKLEVGDIVLLENGERKRVQQVDGEGSDYPYLAGGYWHNTYGMVSFHSHPWYEGESITHKIIPYQEPVKEEKSPEQEAFEAGYWVPFVATATSVCPAWAKDVPTTIKMRDGTESLLDGVICGDGWEWDNLQEEGTIVAYRKAQR